MRKAILFSSISVLVLSLCGCGGDDEGGACFDYASFEGNAPAVAFEAEVVPILRRSCGLSTGCHGAPSYPDRSFLGPPLSDTLDPAQVDQIIAQNVGVDSAKAAGMPRVTAGDANRSFLMHKVDASFECEALPCQGDACGDEMPPGSPLSETDANLIRRWILQGAQKN